VKTETVFDPNERITVIDFQPENYDAFPPASRAWMDGRVVNLHRDREVIAHALVLFPYISGRLRPKSGCGVDIAGTVRELLSPRNVIIDQIELSPLKLPLGTRTASLCDGSYRSAAMLEMTSHDLVFRLSESAYTTLISPRNVVVSSNFGLFTQGKGQLTAMLPAIAAAVMSAGDLGISRLLLPVHSLTGVETELLKRLTAALAAVNLSVHCPLLGINFTALAGFLPHLSALNIFLAERHEHSRSPEDLADFWFARLLSAQTTGIPDAVAQAVERLKAFCQAGYEFSPQETDLIWSL